MLNLLVRKYPGNRYKVQLFTVTEMPVLQRVASHLTADFESEKSLSLIWNGIEYLPKKESVFLLAFAFACRSRYGASLRAGGYRFRNS